MYLENDTKFQLKKIGKSIRYEICHVNKLMKSVCLHMRKTNEYDVTIINS